MKKIICFLLALVCMLAVVACDAGQVEDPGFIVHFETNGAEPIEDIKTLRLEEEPFIAYKGHVFEGWYMDSAFSTPAEFPMDVKSDITLYAKWLQIGYTDEHMDTGLKLDFGHDATMVANVTPDELDFELLESLGYDRVRIDIKYTVSYEKDYSLPIGYAGAPSYVAALLCSDFDKEFDDDYGFQSDLYVKAASNPTKKEMSYTIKFDEIGPKKVVLIFNTLNIQNIVYFKNIEVTYTAEKPAGN